MRSVALELLWPQPASLTCSRFLVRVNREPEGRKRKMILNFSDSWKSLSTSKQPTVELKDESDWNWAFFFLEEPFSSRSVTGPPPYRTPRQTPQQATQAIPSVWASVSLWPVPNPHTPHRTHSLLVSGRVCTRLRSLNSMPRAGSSSLAKVVSSTESSWGWEDMRNGGCLNCCPGGGK